MSSRPFSTRLVPTRRNRALVLGAGAALLSAGLPILIALPLEGFMRAALSIGWCLVAYRDLSRQFRGYRRVAALSIDCDGAVACTGNDGARLPARLLGGSLVLRRVAWLRVALAGGPSYGELLIGPGADPAAWHRLQLIWRQRDGAFGRPRIS